MNAQNVAALELMGIGRLPTTLTLPRCKVPRCKRGGTWTCRDCGLPLCKHHCASKESPDNPFDPAEWATRERWFATCMQCSMTRYQQSFKESPIHACWECGEPIGDAQLIRSRGDLQADICHGCEFWVRAVLARVKEGR